jgi:malate dehydrogenase
MVPMARFCSISGVPLEVFLPREKIDEIVKRTQNGGAEIVNYLKTGSAYYAPASSVVAMVESIVRDKKRILPCAVELNGEYGVHGLFVGVLAKLGNRGIEQVIEIELNSTEKELLQKSASAVRDLVSVLEGK